ncbi:putative sodium/sulfate cotransporter 3, partial [Haematococcus lacustris]
MPLMLQQRPEWVWARAAGQGGVHAPLCAASTVIQAGDVLLLAGHEEWAKKNINDTAFVMLNDVPSSSPPKRNRALVAMFLGLGMVLTQIIP